MNDEARKKFNNVVVGGIGMFVTLRLRGYPAKDGVDGLIDLWLAVLWPLRQWDDEDIDNLRRAFITTARQVDEFPTPKQVINNLEAKVKVAKRHLPPPPQTDAEKRRINEIMADIFKTINVNKEGKMKDKELEPIEIKAGVSIDFLLSLPNITCVTDKDGNVLSDEEARKRLETLKSQGMKTL